MPRLNKEASPNRLNGLISIHNIGFGAAKEIKIDWHFNKSNLASLVDSSIRDFYTKLDTDDTHNFILPNSKVEKQLPLIYISSLSYFKKGWSEMIWEELYLEISYKDILDNHYASKYFKATVYVNSIYVAIQFSKVERIELKNKLTIKSSVI